jgi:hypothetical protein
VEKDDDRNKPIPGTERWHYEEFLRLAAADPDGFDRLADEKADSEAPLQERVALLRAAWKVRGKEALRWFSGAFAREAGTQDRAADALRGFVVRHLASHARAVPEVRGFLRDKVFLDETVNARDRSVAGRAVLEAADPREISTLLATIRGISDAAVAEGALVGLGLNDHADAASALTWLSSASQGTWEGKRRTRASPSFPAVPGPAQALWSVFQLLSKGQRTHEALPFEVTQHDFALRASSGRRTRGL